MTPIYNKKSAVKTDWNDWRWQIKNSINDGEFIITPYTASLIDKSNKSAPLNIIFGQNKTKKVIKKCESIDPLDELKYTKTKHIIHKYKDRVLFLASSICASYCGYCTRSRLAGTPVSFDYEESFAYLRASPKIKQVVISGGDPLMLSNDNLKSLLEGLRKIKSIEVIRIATKLATTLPQRFDKELIKILTNARPVIVSVHVSHPDEITKDFKKVCKKLNKAGVMLNSQSVMIKDVNDNVKTLKNLCQKLIKNFVVPYAIYSCDKIVNGKKYRVPIKKGAELMGKLKARVSGTIVPSYFADIPYAESKVLITTHNVKKASKKFASLTDETGKNHKYINK